jgi:phosphopantothenoylcysteine decarboxylase / phosphopantothenate---cysteine ligase
MLPPDYSLFNVFAGKRVHLGLTGSVAAFKAVDLLRLLRESSIDTGVTFTRSARAFIGPLTLSALGADPVYCSEDNDLDPYSHLAPGRSAQSLIISPATANILAKAANGIADDLLSTQILAFGRPVVFCPAMNPEMWSNQATQENIQRLKSRGHLIIEPHEGRVACGDQGQGRLAPTQVIYYHLLKTLAPQDMAGKSILVTAGPTHEYFDLVRFFSNPSSGRMGLAIALACWLRGANVYFVHGPMSPVFSLPGFEVLPVIKASEMLEVCLSVWEGCDAGFFTAAVSDFAPEPCSQPKFKKKNLEVFHLEMKSNPDILADLSARKKKKQVTIGFAAEAMDLEANARLKLSQKKLDMIVANLVEPGQTPFGSMDNQVMVMDRNGRTESWPCLAKSDIAWRLIDWLSLI